VAGGRAILRAVPRLSPPLTAARALGAPLAAAAMLAAGGLGDAVAAPADHGRTAATGPRIAGCPVFPRNDAWNRDVSREPVDPRSADYLRSIGLARNVHPDFGSGRYGNYGIPITIAPSREPKRGVRFTDYGDESDKGPYPVPAGARVEGGGDRHVLVVQRGGCRLYELFNARRAGGRWEASSGAIFDLRRPRPRPAGWTSADAAGLPIMPGLARPDEASSGAIRHALRFTAPRTQRAYVAPARHAAGASTDRALPPMGLRLRLKRSYSLNGYRGQSLAILRALKTYGMILADNGSPFYISGAADRRWDDEDIEQLKRVPGSAFEAVRAGRLHPQ
jgi:hypothetical protein